MKHMLALALGTGFLFAAAPGSTAEPHSPHAVRAHVEFLADDLLEGRKAGTRGHEIAARYVAAQFAALGLAPAGTQGSWYQSVPLHEQSLDSERTAVTLITPAGTHRWLHTSEVIVTAAPGSGASRLEAPVVFAGFGLDAPELGFDDYADLDVRGRIVAVLLGTPEGTPSEVGAHLAASKAARAALRGAVGMLTIDTRRARSLFPWERRLENDAAPRMTWIGADGRPNDEAPGIAASAALNQPAAEALFAGALRSLDAVLDEADRPNAQPRGFTLPVRARIDWHAVETRHASPNVLGLLPGADPKRSNEVVLMMAHLDHVGQRRAKDGDTIVNGALDNAAGIAVMLEAARALANGRRAPRRSVLFLANTAEEQGLLGTYYFAAHPTVALDRIVAVVNVDVPILTYDFQDLIAFGAEHSTLSAAAASAAAAEGIALSPDPMPEQGLFTRSDHYALVRRGIPALFLAPGHAAGGAEAWQEYLEHHYHQPSDDLAQPIDWQAAAQFTRLTGRVLREIADGNLRPRWYQDSFFGLQFAGEAPKAVRAAE